MMGHPRPAVEAEELFAPPRSEGKPRPRKCNPSSGEAQPAEAMDLEEAEIGGRRRPGRLPYVPLDFRVVIGVVPVSLPVGVADRRPARRVLGAGAARQAFNALVEAGSQEKADG